MRHPISHGGVPDERLVLLTDSGDSDTVLNKT